MIYLMKLKIYVDSSLSFGSLLKLLQYRALLINLKYQKRKCGILQNLTFISVSLNQASWGQTSRLPPWYDISTVKKLLQVLQITVNCIYLRICILLFELLGKSPILCIQIIFIVFCKNCFQFEFIACHCDWIL